MIIQLLFAGLFYFTPIGDKVEGNYLEYLCCDKAVIEIWNDQIDAVADIAKHQGFCEVARGKRTLLVSYEQSKDLRAHLWKMGQDAAVERIRPFPSSFTIDYRGEFICGHQRTQRQATGRTPTPTSIPD